MKVGQIVQGLVTRADLREAVAFAAAAGGRLAERTDADGAVTRAGRNGPAFDVGCNLVGVDERSWRKFMFEGELVFGAINLAQEVNACVQAGRASRADKIRDCQEKKNDRRH